MKRRILSVLLVLMMLFTIMPTAALAEKSSTDVAYTVEGGDIYFDTSTGTITDCDSTVTKAIIPSTINGVEVKKIGWAFKDCTKLKSVKIPSSVTAINRPAFEGCTSLKKIVVDPNNASYCSEDGVLFKNDKTEIVRYPIGKTGTEYVIPNSVTKIGYGAFGDCSKLTSITIPSSVTIIDVAAFWGCTGLTSMVIPNSVTGIDNFAFYGCTNLESITIPGSVTIMGEQEFAGCNSLKSINVDVNNSAYSSVDGVLFNKEKTVLLYYPHGRPYTQYAVPNGVATIFEFAFADCTRLTSIEIPSSVTYIIDMAFNGCRSLKDVYYSGSEEQWKAISIAEYNDPLTSATIHYNSEGIQTPLNITLTSKEVSRDTSEIEYELSANITSTSSKTANYINLTLDLPDGVTSENVTASNPVIKKLEPSETVVVKWNVTVPIRLVDANYTFVVKATSDDFPVGVVCTAQDTIIVAGKGLNDYTWIFGEDNYSFLHNGKTFGDKYRVLDKDLAAFLDNLSETEIKSVASGVAKDGKVKNLLNNNLRKWEGSCYGMSLSMALFKVGANSQSMFGADTTYGLEPTDALISFVNIHFMEQYTNIGSNTAAASNLSFNKDDNKRTLNEMWEKAKNIGSRGKNQQPYIVCMAEADYSHKITEGYFNVKLGVKHAVVCFAAEDCFYYTENLLGIKTYYDKRLLIADPNSDHLEYIYIIDDFSSAFYTGGPKYNSFGYKVASLSELDSNNYTDMTNNYNARIIALANTSINVASTLGNIAIKNGEIAEQNGIDASELFVAKDADETDSEPVTYLLKDTADSYTITPYEGSSINTSVYFDDYAVDIDVDAESIDVLKNGKVELTGATGDAKLSFAINGSSFDFVDIEGKCDGDVVIDLNGENIVISGDISDYSVSNMDRDTNETDAVIHGDRNTKIEKEDNKLKVSTDEDADGVYETELDSNELKHTYDEFKDNGDGTHSVICSVCKHSYVESHVFGEKTCTVCGATNPDYKPPRPVHIHRYTETVTEPTCTEKGYTTYTCICGSSYVANYVDALGHTEVVDPAVAATCEKTGLTEGKHCSVCNEVLVAQKETPKTEHKFSNGKCSVCGAADPNYVAPVVNPFKDVKEGDAFYDEILWAADKGIIKGDGTGNYNPNDGITRAQIVMILWNAAGNKEASKPSGFADVKDGAWYAKAVAWAVENGITNGTDLGFEPDRVCTRAEIVTFLHRANNKPAPAAAASFTDLTQDWYKDAVAWAVENGITKGVGDNRFAPNDTCTRGQAAAFMYRLAQLAK